MELGDEFKAYIAEKIKDPEKLEEIWDISPITVLKRDGRPPFTYGYHPAMIIHFTNFISEMEQEIQNNKYT
jgi:hypothetical protein